MDKQLKPRIVGFHIAPLEHRAACDHCGDASDYIVQIPEPLMFEDIWDYNDYELCEPCLKKVEKDFGLTEPLRFNFGS